MAFEPSRIKSVHTDDDKVKILVMDQLPEYSKEDYLIEDNKDFEKYLFDIEKSVRLSYEYREFVQYLRKYMDMNQCSFFEGVSNIENPSIKIHIHHTPITLFEIVVTVFNKRQQYRESLEIESIAEEVTYLHYLLMIGLIPLCETIHELAHNEYIFIPNTAVKGEYRKFIEAYEPWIPRQTKEKLDRLEEYTKIYDYNTATQILQPNYIYLDTSGSYNLPKMEDIMYLMNKKMESIKNNNFSIIPRNIMVDL